MKKSIERSQDGQEKKIIESFIENYQRGIQQRHCMDGIIRGLIRNIGDNWKEIGNIGKKLETLERNIEKTNIRNNSGRR